MRKPSLRVSCLWLNGAKERDRRSEHLVLNTPSVGSRPTAARSLGHQYAYLDQKRGVLRVRWSIPNSSLMDRCWQRAAELK
jgi:hypothetical protein